MHSVLTRPQRVTGLTLTVLIAIVCIGAAVRLLGALNVPLVFDEYQWLTVVDQISLIPPRLPLHGDAHPAAPAYFVAAGKWVAGKNLVGYRIAAIAAGTALIWIAWALARRHHGVAAGLTAAAMVAANEYLFGISRLSTEKIFLLTFAAGSLLAFERAVESGRPREFAVFGACLGISLMSKETALLWLPILAWELARRRGWAALRQRGPVIAAALVIIAVLPDLIWNLFLSASSESLSDRGLTDQMAKLGVGWSFGPTALFFRPAFELVDRGISEYPSMTFWPGGLVLGTAIVAIFMPQTESIRLWLRLGWAPFLFFSVFGNSNEASPEFWWADLAVVPFVLVTAVMAARVSPVVITLAVGLSLPGIVMLTTVNENCYPPKARSSIGLLRSCEEEQRALVGMFARDPASLTRFGKWRLPASEPYRWAASEYLQRLLTPAPPASTWWPVVRREDHEIEISRMQSVLQRIVD